MERIERNPLPGETNARRCGRLPKRVVTAHQPLQSRCQLLAKALRLKELPFIECRAVPESETGEKVPSVQPGRFAKEEKAVRADIRCAVAVALGRRTSGVLDAGLRMIMIMVFLIKDVYAAVAISLPHHADGQPSIPAVSEEYAVFSLHDLNVFVEAAQAKNFSLAARRLYLSQPAVSVHIGNLEKQLGLELFHRKGRSIQLSEAGGILLPLAQQCLRDAKNIQETMDGLKGWLVGELVIACSTTVGKYILPRLVAGFRRKYPEVRVVISVMSRRAALDAVLDGRAETAVVSALAHHAELGYQEFLKDQIVLIVPADHPWADGRTVCPEDLLSQAFIMREESAAAHEMLAEGLAQRGLDLARLAVVLTLANDEAIEMSVEAGIGVAFVSRLAAAHGLELRRVVEVPVDGLNFNRPIYIVRHHRHPSTPLQQAFWDFALAPENDTIRSIAQKA